MLTPQQSSELERRGVRNVQILLRDAAGRGQGSMVPLNIPGDGPSRRDVETWLRDQEIVAKGIEKRQYKLMLGWTIAATVFAGIGAVAAIFAAIRW